MDTTSIEVAGLRALAWADRRLQEKSTIVGIVGWLGTIGFASFGGEISAHADTITALAGMLSTALVTTSTKPRQPELPLAAPVVIPSVATTATDPAPIAPADTPKEKDMSIGSELKNVLGIVLGILIPGASKATTNLTTTIQNEIAKVYGEAATAMAKELAVDTTGMSGPDKVFAIVKALVATAQKDGFKGDLKVLGDVAVDIAQAAYRAAEPNFASDIVALASALTANPLVTVAATLVGEVVQSAADKAAAPIAQAA